MKKTVFVIVAFLIVGCLTLTHLSCSSSDSDAPVATPAGVQQTSLDETTIRDALTFIENNIPGCTMENTSAQNKTTVRSLLGLAGGISDNIALYRSAQSTRTAAAVVIDETQDGDCGGYFTFILNHDEQTGSITGNIAFNNFCQEVDDGSGGQQTLQVNGSALFSGSVNTAANESDLLSLLSNLESLSVSTGAGGLTIQTGADTISVSLDSLEVSVNGSTISIAMNSLTVSATVDGETSNVTINDLDATVIDSDDYMEVDGSVQYVDEDGYVDISVDDLRVDDDDGVTAGTLTVTGAGGTDIKITYQASGVFLVEADTNGDGTYDYQPGEMDCSDLDIDELLGNFL